MLGVRVLSAPKTDQSSRLPKHRTFVLTPHRECLDQSENEYITWKQDVQEVLSDNELVGLIDPNLPRPMEDNDDARNWMQVSLYTGSWLKGTLASITLQRLYHQVANFQYADDVYKAIEKDIASQRIYIDVAQLKRYREQSIGSFPTASRYVAEHLSLRAAMVLDGWSIPPYETWTEVIIQLLTTHEDIADDAMQRVQDGKLNRENFTEADLNTAVGRLLDHLRFRERSL